jgi:glycosyltransferase involved in cell wall biosynthesis
MKIGVYFTARKNDGGVYQYSIALLESLYRIKKNKYIIVSISKDIPNKFKRSSNFKIVDVSFERSELMFKIRDAFSRVAALAFPRLISMVYKYGLFDCLTPFYRLSQLNIIHIFEREKIDLVFYPTSSDLSFLSAIPAVVTVHDLQHRLNPRFKEVSAGGRWEYREYGYQNISKKAYRILVDSAIGSDDMLTFYPKSKGKVVILPYLAPSYINPNISSGVISRVKQKYSLPNKYIFYPAKFWPHKNHKNLIWALNILNKQGRKINLVLTGSKNADFSSFDEVMRIVKTNGLDHRVFYLGLVTNEELSVIYKLATVLAMPTYFGPTNIPVLEAWTMGIPVIYSDIRGCREQLGDAGLLINPRSSKDIADKILKIYTQPELASELVMRGLNRTGRWTFTDFSSRVAKIIRDFGNEKNAKSKNNKK